MQILAIARGRLHRMPDGMTEIQERAQACGLHGILLNDFRFDLARSAR